MSALSNATLVLVLMPRPQLSANESATAAAVDAVVAALRQGTLLQLQRLVGAPPDWLSDLAQKCTTPWPERSTSRK